MFAKYFNRSSSKEEKKKGYFSRFWPAQKKKRWAWQGSNLGFFVCKYSAVTNQAKTHFTFKFRSDIYISRPRVGGETHRTLKLSYKRMP